MTKPNNWGSLEPFELRRACSVMACGDGWKAFVAQRYGNKWIFNDHGVPLTGQQKDDGYVLIERDEFYALAVEYGYSRLKATFGDAAH